MTFLNKSHGGTNNCLYRRVIFCNKPARREQAVWRGYAFANTESVPSGADCLQSQKRAKRHKNYRIAESTTLKIIQFNKIVKFLSFIMLYT